jgi:hypothetical protein
MRGTLVLKKRESPPSCLAWQWIVHALPYGAMASESLRPTPASSGGGYAKYLIGLLLLLGGGLGVFLATRKDPAPPPEATPPPKVAERSTALAQDTLQLPVEEEPDAGAPPPVAEEPTKKKVRGAADPWACQGDVPSQEIKALLADRQVQIRACYEKRLRVNNMLQGSLRLQVRIGNDGKVQATRAGGTLRDPEVFNCVQNLAKKWTFPAPTGGSCAVFDAPYNFTPKP